MPFLHEAALHMLSSIWGPEIMTWNCSDELVELFWVTEADKTGAYTPYRLAGGRNASLHTNLSSLGGASIYIRHKMVPKKRQPSLFNLQVHGSLSTISRGTNPVMNFLLLLLLWIFYSKEKGFPQKGADTPWSGTSPSKRSPQPHALITEPSCGQKCQLCMGYAGHNGESQKKTSNF